MTRTLTQVQAELIEARKEFDAQNTKVLELVSRLRAGETKVAAEQDAEKKNQLEVFWCGLLKRYEDASDILKPLQYRKVQLEAELAQLKREQGSKQSENTLWDLDESAA